MNNAIQCKKDIRYSEGSSLPRHSLDVHAPEHSRATIVWFYGGGLRTGVKDNEETIHVARTLAGLDCTVVVPNYGLYPDIKFPEQLEDAAAAVRYTDEHIRNNNEPLVLAGHSAGGWITAMLAMDPQWLPGITVNGFIPISGQMTLHTSVAEELGIIAGDPDHRCAPAAYVRTGLPPLLAMAGDQDNPGRWDQQVLLGDRLKAAGYTGHQVVQVPDRTHSTIIHRMGEPGDPVLSRIGSFIAALEQN